MKTTLPCLFLLFAVLIISCTEPVQQISKSEIVDSVVTALAEQAQLEEEAKAGFDEELANKLGADQYGMAQYVIAFLKKGPNRDMSNEEAMELQMAHLDNIERLANEGKLAVAGPFMDAGDLMGIYVFNVKTVEEAKALTESDPAIARGSLVMELYTWYGSAAMKEVNSIHSRIMAKSVTESVNDEGA